MNRERMQQIIKEQLPKVCTSASYYTYGNIPKDKFNNARAAYASSLVSYDDVIGLTDDTFFGGAKRGFMFTYTGFFFDGCNDINSYACSMNRISPFYDLENFNEMLEALNEASAETEQGGFLSSLLDFGVSLLGEYVESGIEQMKINQAKKAAEEMDEMVEALENFRTFLLGVSDSLDKVLKMKKKKIDIADLKNMVIRLAGMLTGDEEFINDNLDEINWDWEEDDMDTVISGGELVNTIAELVDTEEEEFCSAHLMRNVKRFKSDVKRFLTDGSKNVDIILKAAERLTEALNSSVDRINLLIDMAYDEMD